jgi:hypothetical protein
MLQSSGENNCVIFLKFVIMGPVRVYMNEDYSNYSPWSTIFPARRCIIIIAFIFHYDAWLVADVPVEGLRYYTGTRKASFNDQLGRG